MEILKSQGDFDAMDWQYLPDGEQRFHRERWDAIGALPLYLFFTNANLQLSFRPFMASG